MAPVEELENKVGEEEDSPVIKELKQLDDQYLALEREYDRERQALQLKYTEKQRPVLEQRAARLAQGGEEGAPTTGTPACKGFWVQALQNHPTTEDIVEEWDQPVLEYLTDVKEGVLDKDDVDKGFKLEFHFAENPYFTKKVITKEYHTEEGSPYTGDIDVKEVRSDSVDWKEGKDVTVAVVKKKVKGGGAKKAKEKAKEKVETRNSFFRYFFRNLKEGDAKPDDLSDELLAQLEMEGEENDHEEIVTMLLENDLEVGCAIRDNIIPFAVRWYTGEAAPSDDDEESEEEDQDPDDEDDDDDSEEESSSPSPKGKKGKKKAGAKAPDAGGQKQEECKQQ